MGPQQILRTIAILVVAVAWGSARAEPAPPVAVIDLGDGNGLGDGDAAALRRELAASGFAVMSSPELDAVLSGQEAGKDLEQALAALARARAAFGALDCATAIAASEAALPLIAARAAAGIASDLPARTALGYLLLCHDRAGSFDQALRAAAVLRALASPAELVAQGLEAAVLDKYPALDATAAVGLMPLELTVESGAAVAIDLGPARAGPRTVYLPPGRHLVAAAAGSRRTGVWVEVSHTTKTLALTLVEQDVPLSRVSERIATWKAQGPDPAGVAALFEQLLLAAQGQPWNPSSPRSPLLLVLGAASTPAQLQLWASDGPGQRPTMTALPTPQGPWSPQTAAAVLEALRARALAWRPTPAPEPAGSPNAEALLRETPEAEASPRRKPTQWWVYAALAGAVTVGGAVILANELSDDTQRVELRWR